MIKWLSKDEDNPHFPGEKKIKCLNVAGTILVLFSLEPSTACNNNLEAASDPLRIFCIRICIDMHWR